MFMVWTLFFLFRKDLRKPMLWSGGFYIVVMTLGFIFYFFIPKEIARSITPGYWTPHTIFDLGRITGGYAVEDVLFMFFAGGIATAIYEFFFKKKITMRRVSHFKRRYALLFGVFGATVCYKIFYLNDIYLLVAFNFFGALAILWQRKDLIAHSILGGVLFLGIYAFMFTIFKEIYPNFLADMYNLQLTSGIILWGIPFEEYLFALTFGMLWAPIYEYEHRYKDT